MEINKYNNSNEQKQIQTKHGKSTKMIFIFHLEGKY